MAVADVRQKDGGLAKTKRSGDADATGSRLRLGPASELVVADYTGLELRLRLGEQDFFEEAEAALGALPEGFPSMWPDVAALADADRRWFLRAVHLLTLNDEAAPASFSRTGALSRLTRWAGARATEPTAADGSFEREVLTVSGWTGAVLGHLAAGPSPEDRARLRAVYDPQEAAGGENGGLAGIGEAVARIVAGRTALWDPPSGGGQPEDLQRLSEAAARVESIVADVFSPYVRARFDSPLNEEFHYADHVRGSMERPQDRDAQVAYLYGELRAEGWRGDADEVLAGLRDLLESGRAPAGQVARLIKRTPSHDLPDTWRKTSTFYDLDRGSPVAEAHLPADTAPAMPRGEWRWRLVGLLIHELLHRLAHPVFVERARAVTRPLVLTEGCAELLTAEALAAAYGADPAVRRELAGDAGEPPARPATPGPAAEIREIAGPDNFRAAYFLGETHLIGLD
ncbi:hypothetical protein ACIBQ1_53840 [Nonomuraea sp. NPDC050153]|uniref:hypothetical protein n=1 Tax=Nonomuraea sp. NPDC050153 TaxID=3364359 RepID=UPI0037AFE2A4